VTNRSLSRAHARAAGRITLAVALLTGATAGVVAHVADDTAPAESTALAGLSGQPLVLGVEPGGPALPARRAGAEVRKAQERRAAAQAAAAQTRRRAEAARSALRDPRAAARAMLARHGWSGSQFSCLDALWTKESGWDPRARNPGSGAFGIAQALPAAKMASAGPDWRTNPVTQIAWGLRYIDDVYGSPCAAWAHSRAVNWY
jgi:hypothetical protein